MCNFTHVQPRRTDGRFHVCAFTRLLAHTRSRTRASTHAHTRPRTVTHRHMCALAESTLAYLQIGRFVSSIVDTLYSALRRVPYLFRGGSIMKWIFFQNRESALASPSVPIVPFSPGCPSTIPPRVPYSSRSPPSFPAAVAATTAAATAAVDSLTAVVPDKNVSNSSNRPRLVSVSIV